MRNFPPFDYTPPAVATYGGHEPDVHYAYGDPTGALAVWTQIFTNSSNAQGVARVGRAITRETAHADLAVSASVSFYVYHYLDCYKVPLTGYGSHSRGRLSFHLASSSGSDWRIEASDTIQIWDLKEEGVSGSQGTQELGSPPDQASRWEPALDCAMEPRRTYYAYVEISAESDADGSGPAAVSRSSVIFKGQVEHIDVVQTPREQAYSQASSTVLESTGRSLGPAVGVSAWGPGRLDVFTSSGSGFAHTWCDSSQPLGSWELIGGAEDGDQVGVGSAACSWGPGRLDVVKIDQFGDLHHVWFDEPHGWGTWDNLGGNLDPSCEPTLTSWGPGRLDVFARLSSGRLAHRWFSARSGWQPWEYPLAAGSWTTSLSAAAPDTGRLTIAAVSFGSVWIGGYEASVGWRELDALSLGWALQSEQCGVALLARAPTFTQWAPHGPAPRPVEDLLDLFAIVETNHGPHLAWFSGIQDELDVRLTSLPDANYRRIAAASWEPDRLDVFVSVEVADGDLYRIGHLEHLWKATGDEEFSQETLDV